MNYYNTNEKYKILVGRANLQAEKNGGEVEEHILAMLEDTEEDLNECLIGMMYDIKNAELDLGSIAKMETEIKEKKVFVENKINRMKIILASALGNQSLTDGVVKTTKAVSKSLKVTGDVPAMFVTTEIVPETTKAVVDNKAVKEYVIEKGGILPWAEIVSKKAVK